MLLIEIMVAEIPPPMPTPQIAASAPSRDCPICGRRMQILSVTESSYHYVCYSHTLQNSANPEPYYLNIPFKSLTPEGKVKEKD